MRPSTAFIYVGQHLLHGYLATTPDQWRQGLVDQQLDGVDGMLFSFDSDVQWPFHLAGMTTPVLIAYFDANGQFSELAYLAVGAGPSTPAQPYRYALELIGDHATVDGALALLPDLFDGLTPP